MPKHTKRHDLILTPNGMFVPAVLILLNTFVFLFFTKIDPDAGLLKALVLSPKNLHDGKIWCLVTSGFIHKDLIHLAGNMLGIFVFAGIVERKFGVLKTLLIYFGALMISMLFSLAIYVFVLHKNVAIIGASGALMGLISTAMLIDPFKITFEMILPIPVMIKAWIFFYLDIRGFLTQEAGGVSHIAHLFGFLSVGMMVYFLNKREKTLMRNGLIINAVTFLILLFVWRFLTRASFMNCSH